jgi:hypothetical protein
MNLRQLAQGEACAMCGLSDDTVVLHHLRAGNPGMGRKPPDHHGIYLCAVHHHYVHNDGIADHKAMLLAYMRQIDRWLQMEALVLQ